MALLSGTRLGAYEIVAPLGKGGMGEVYRARDTRLKREVAIKVLPEAFSHDPDRLARFQREAELLATLNHPNIAAVYGLEQSAGVSAIVLELVEGETLAQRLASRTSRGAAASGGGAPRALEIDEALNIARQTADALEAAHEKGIIHRDLKPANIALTANDQVKVLDFGLAKAMETAPADANLTHSPTLSMMATQAGVILGTAAYMSPEQAKGLPADARSDVFSFGSVLYEMLTGQPPFNGDTVPEVLASVLVREPDFGALPPNLNPRLPELLRRCLEKNPKRRWQAVGDLRAEIETIAVAPRSVSAAAQALAPPRPLWRRALPAVLSAIVAAAIAGATVWWYEARAIVPSVTQFFVYPPEKTTFVTFNRVGTSVVISPDGSKLAFTARDASGKILLWIRPIDSLTSQPLSGTDDAAYPFWSPDSRFIAYFVQRKLLKIAAGGGPPQTLCTTDVDNARGGSWSQDGTIVFSAGPNKTLERVSSAGGQPSEFMRLAKGQTGYVFPWFLPNGRHFLFYSYAASEDVAGVYVGSLDVAESKRLAAADSAAVYDSQSGHLLFVRQGTLLAQPFDPKTLALTGESFPIAERVETLVTQGIAAFSVSTNCILAYGVGAGTAAGLQMAWFDRQGKQVEAVGSQGNYRGLDLAPDGKRVAVHRHDGSGGDIWVTDLSRSTTSRFTFDASQENQSPIWSPDGTRIVYGSFRNGKGGLYQKLANNAGTEERLVESDAPTFPVSWSPDGGSIVYEVVDPKTSNDLWVLPLSGDRKPSPLLHTPFLETHGQVSPDGKWLAYYSNETGRTEVYVQPFPSGAGKWQISTNGGVVPRWRHDGRELFYMTLLSGGKMMAVDVSSRSSTVEAGTPKDLFDSPYVNLTHTGTGPGAGFYHAFAVSEDGQRFLIPHLPSTDTANLTMPIAVVVNWAAGLRK